MMQNREEKTKQYTDNKTIGAAVAKTIKIFGKAKIPNPEQEAKWLFCNLLNVNLANLILKLQSSITAAIKTKLEHYIKLRIKNIPLAYIIKEASFYGYTFEVSNDTLIPRLDSETIIEEIKLIAKQSKSKLTLLERKQNRNIINIVDLGCGTGCLSNVATLELIKMNYKVKNVLLVDISKKALVVAKNNAKILLQQHNVNVQFANQDFTKPQTANLLNNFCKNNKRQKNQEEQNAKYIIICNPPYLTSEQMQNIDNCVKKEPELALFGGKNGMYCYSNIINWIPILKQLPHGKNFTNIVFEIDPELKYNIVNELKQKNLTQIRISKDQENRDRVISCKIDTFASFNINKSSG
ncbi:MAG: peptide chain release factor N(5)-glutamine methyltransferase [Alphaproteobacteria bacterium]|nr:peptide chain release factor N(5)-glutamine methyltransferase [Rickettsiales bacterium]